MTKRQAEKLNVGDHVTCRDRQFTTPRAITASGGEVIEKGYSGFKVKWGDGVILAYRNDNAGNIHSLS